MSAPKPKPSRQSRATTAAGREAVLEREILTALERNARISYAELAERTGLSKSPAWARVRDLEQRGVITGYRADIEPAAVGLDIHAYAHVSIQSVLGTQFEDAVLRHPAVLECHSTAGDADYLLHVLVKNVAQLDSLLREVSRMPGVLRLSTTVAMKTIKRRGPIMACVQRD